MSVWFAQSAIAPELQAAWGLDASQAGWLTSAVQVGFVAGTLTAAILNVADVIPSRSYFAVSAVLAAGANLLLLAVPGYEAALVTHTTGAASAPPRACTRKGMAFPTVRAPTTVPMARPRADTNQVAAIFMAGG